MNIYETERLLNEYLLFHYGSDAEVLPWANGPREALGFARRSVTALLDASLLREGIQPLRALDLGCAVGRSAYELAQVAGEVIGIDYSANLIRAAEAIRTNGELSYLRHDEGTARTALVARRPPGAEADRIRFERGDALNLRPDIGSFGIVHAANLLCRLSDPSGLLDQLPTLLSRGGQLLLTTPCTWLEEFTPAARWPRGSTEKWLSQKLEGDFELASRQDLPFVIREHARKYQWSMALGMRWVRK